MSSELQLDVCCLSCCGGDIWWTLTKERQACCCLQVELCDPCLSALCVPPWPKRCYINTLPFLSFPFLSNHTLALLWNGWYPHLAINAVWCRIWVSWLNALTTTQGRATASVRWTSRVSVLSNFVRASRVVAPVYLHSIHLSRVDRLFCAIHERVHP